MGFRARGGEAVRHAQFKLSLAIAPTATIANITGATPSIEPVYKNLYVKSNQGGEFIVVNDYLVKEPKTLGLWDHELPGKNKNTTMAASRASTRSRSASEKNIRSV